MRQIRRKLIVCLSATGLALLMGGCPRQEAPPRLAEDEWSSEEAREEANEESNETDATFEIRIDNVYVTDLAPAPASQVEEFAAAAEGVAMAGEEAAGEESEEGEDQGPRTATILFDLMVRFAGPGEAPESVGLEFTHASPVAGEKGRFRQELITHEMQPGEVRQEPFELEIPDYEEGDAFSVMLRESVPPPSRSWAEWVDAGE